MEAGKGNRGNVLKRVWRKEPSGKVEGELKESEKGISLK